MLDFIGDLIYWCLPRTCIACGFNSQNSQIDLCRYCYNCLPWIDDRCYKCGAALTAIETLICSICTGNPPPYDCLHGIFSYEPPVSNLINRLKFNRDLYPGKLFSQLMLTAIKNEWYINKPLPQLIVPVPLHLQRQRQRGYNQSIEIAKPIGKSLNIPLAINKCVRVKNTTAQARLSREKRIMNVHKAFMTEIHPAYKHVAILDDVVTTGSTVRAVSLALQEAGVENIDIWCICRA